MEQKLDVLIATYGPEGLKKVSSMTLPRVEGVRYLVTWQQAPNDVSAEIADRDDVMVKVTDSIGLSRNRNFGILIARAPYCLIADNDLHYTSEGLQAVIDAFERHPEVDVALFKYDGEEKYYPSDETDVSQRMPKGYNVSSIEIAFRRESIGKLRFNERFGLGAPYGVAEEEVFLFDCRRAGLKCRFFPITITRHDGPSTGMRPIVEASVAQGEGAFLRHVHGVWRGAVRVPLLVWRFHRAGRLPLGWGLWHVSKGFLAYRRDKR